METAYIFNWEAISSNAYTYGSVITVNPAGGIDFKNDLQPVGKAVYAWQNLSGEQAGVQGIRSTVILPTLVPEESYEIWMDVLANDEAIGITLDFFDQGGQVIDHRLIVGNKVSFIYPAQAVDYKISLIKLNNTVITFKQMVLIPTAVTEEYVIKWQPQLKIMNFQRKGLVDTPESSKVIVQPNKKTMNSIYIDSKYDSTYNCLIDPAIMKNQQQLDEYIMAMQRFYVYTWRHMAIQDVAGYGIGMMLAVTRFQTLLT